MRSDRNLTFLLGAATLSVICAGLGGLAYLARPLPPDGDPILGTAQLVMFETDLCSWCEQFRRKTARQYQSTDYAQRAPLRFMSVDDGPPPKRYRLTSFRPAPMLVLFDEYGRELARLEKEPASSEIVETLVRRNLRKPAKT